MEVLLKTPMSNYTKKEFTKLASNSMAWWLQNIITRWRVLHESAMSRQPF